MTQIYYCLVYPKLVNANVKDFVNDNYFFW